jgi:hypothetical protein
VVGDSGTNLADAVLYEQTRMDSLDEAPLIHLSRTLGTLNGVALRARYSGESTNPRNRAARL